MATSMVVRPGEWNELHDAWFRVLPDPLGADRVRVTVHRNGADLWLYVEGACAGVHFQTIAPDTIDQPEERR